MNTFKILLKTFFNDIRQRIFYYEILSTIIGVLPGRTGHFVRRQFFSRSFGEMGEDVVIHKNVVIVNPNKLQVGDKVRIGVGNYIQAGGGIQIGDFTLLGPYVKIWSQNHRFQETDLPIQAQGYEYKKVKIGKDVWVGANSFIMPGAEIGDHCIVSAGSVVGAKQYPASCLLAGNPARKIGERK